MEMETCTHVLDAGGSRWHPLRGGRLICVITNGEGGEEGWHHQHLGVNKNYGVADKKVQDPERNYQSFQGETIGKARVGGRIEPDPDEPGRQTIPCKKELNSE